MTFFEEERYLLYTPEQLFDLVWDVAQYPAFLPWLSKAKVYNQKKIPLLCQVEENFCLGSLDADESFCADLVLRYSFFEKEYTSYVTGKRNEWIRAQHIKGPFHHLQTLWTFKQCTEAQATKVHCAIEFDLGSSLLSQALTLIFDNAAKKMVDAFSNRAQHCYG